MPETSSLRFASFHLDLGTEQLWRGAEAQPLTRKAFAVLRYLVEHAGQLVTKEELIAVAWAVPYVSDMALAACIREIRRALEDPAYTPQFVATVRGRGYRFLAAVTVETHPGTAVGAPVAVASCLPGRLVGREGELAQLQRCWAQAQAGTRQVVFVTGEAGIGKTTLVDAFVAWVEPTARVWLGRGQCLEQHGAGEPYLPLLEALGRWGRGPDGGQLVTVLRQQAPSWLLQLPALVPEDAYEALQRRGGGVTRARMLRELAEAVEGLTATRPVVLVLEDLHWSDTATVDWLAYVARRREAARRLVLGTYRPMEAHVQGHPVHPVAQELQRHGQGHALGLGYFSEAAVAAYLGQRCGAPPAAALVRALHQRTTGNPLFVTAVVDTLVRQGQLREAGTGAAGDGDLDVRLGGVPDSLRQLMEQQLTQLAPDVQALLEAASVAGQAFGVAAVAAAVGQAVDVVEEHCATLARQGQFLRAGGTDVWPDGTVAERYGFVHDLYRETLYARVPGGRRVRWHRQIGARLEAGYGPQARERAAELAEHFVRGRDPARAVPYLQYAGEQAVQRSAYQEALRHLTQGLALLGTLPETLTRVQQELDLQMALGPVLMARQGFASAAVAQVYARARDLCQRLGETPQLFPALWGVWAFYAVHVELQTAQPLAERLLALAQHTQNPAHLLQAHRALGQTLFYLGALAPAHAHLEQSLARYEPQQHHAHTLLYGQDSGVFCLALSADVLALQGFPDQARQRMHQALRLARALAHPLSLAIVLTIALRFYQLRREQHMVQELTTSLTALASEHGFALFVASGTIMQGWVLVEQGQQVAGIDQMRQGLARYTLTGAQASVLHYQALLAEAYGKGGQPDEGLNVIATALGFMRKTANRVYEAELYRLQGELLLVQQRQGPPAGGTGQKRAEIAESFLQALDIARQQQAKLLELRAAMSLARLWQQQGKRAAAQALLAPIYGWFTEGFDTADLQEARALLEALG
jgi:predicted ATPase/DNA-binding winged helix-turn-helix (wHTH) protein